VLPWVSSSMVGTGVRVKFNTCTCFGVLVARFQLLERIVEHCMTGLLAMLPSSTLLIRDGLLIN
jgi:hypothetical protein